MAKSAQEQDTALGAELIRNDKWLNWNILRADEWATGTGEELLSGSAWRRFCERLWTLDDKLHAANVPTDPATRADGFRHVAMLANAFDVALEDPIPGIRRSAGRIAEQDRWDCPDAICVIPIEADGVYRLRGRRGTSLFGLQVAAGIRTLRTRTPTSGMAPTGASSSSSADRRAAQLAPARSGRVLTSRQFFYDWETERPSPLWIAASTHRTSPASSYLDPAAFARLDAIATHVETSQTSGRHRVRSAAPLGNAFPPKRSAAPRWARNGTGRRAPATTASRPTGARTGTRARAKYWSIDLCNFWLESLDYANHQSSLNGHQAVVDPDGVFRADVTHDDPGVPN